MLKYFGLKEILYGLKKFAVVIVAVTVAFAALGYLLNRGADEGEVAQDEVFSSSHSYIFEAEIEDQQEKNKQSDALCAANAAAMLRADFCKDYVYNKLLEKYSKEEILEYTGTKTALDNASHIVLNECVKVEVLSETSIVNFYTLMKNEEFSKDTVDHFNDYLVNTVVEQIPNLKAYASLGSTTVKVPLDTLDLDMEYEVSAPSGKTGIVVMAIIGFVLSVCVVLVYVLFKPTVSDKAGFEEYGSTVIDEFSAHKNNAGKFAADILKKKVDEAAIKNLAVVSTVTNRFVAQQQQVIADGIQALGDDKTVVKTAVGVINDFAQFESIKQCDGVILVERKGVTYHSDLDNTVRLMNKYDITVVGVVLV